jgi:hypothetical protein
MTSKKRSYMEEPHLLSTSRSLLWQILRLAAIWFFCVMVSAMFAGAILGLVWHFDNPLKPLLGGFWSDVAWTFIASFICGIALGFAIGFPFEAFSPGPSRRRLISWAILPTLWAFGLASNWITYYLHRDTSQGRNALQSFGNSLGAYPGVFLGVYLGSRVRAYWSKSKGETGA